MIVEDSVAVGMDGRVDAAGNPRNPARVFGAFRQRLANRQKGKNMDTNKPENPLYRGNADPKPGHRPSGVSPMRRKLIKSGAFVPPVVLTLRSGAALAQTSTEAACLAANQAAAQDAANSDPDFDASAASDSWLRKRVVVREVRRVRKKNGKFVFRGANAARVYAHQNGDRNSWLSLRPGRSRRKWRLDDTGKTIQVYDSTGATLLLEGNLLRRRGKPGRRYVSLSEVERYGIVETDAKGQPVLDENGQPSIGVIIDPAGNLQSQHVSASCWASLGVDSTVQI
jgi:hypothetical protein